MAPENTPRPQRSRRRLIGWLLALLSIPLIALGGWRLAGALGPSEARWIPVERRDLVVGVQVEGELEAVESLLIKPPQIPRLWNFKISMMAPEGSVVQEGQPVLAFDTTELRQRLQSKIAERDSVAKQLEKKVSDLAVEKRQAQLNLAEARGNLRRADLKLATPEDTVERVTVEKAKIDQNLAQLEIDSYLEQLQHMENRGAAELRWLREKKDQAFARVEELQEFIQQMTVKAPRSGTVIHLANWRGEKKKVGDSTHRSQNLLEIPDLDRMRATGLVDEADAGRLSEGQEVTLRLDAYPDRVYRGRVKAIHRAVQRKSPFTSEKAVKIDVELAATDRERMRPGMRFRGEVEVERVVDSLVVPQEAIRFGPQGPWVVRKTLWGKAEVAPTFGARNSRYFEVLEGLSESDRLWVETAPEEGVGG